MKLIGESAFHLNFSVETPNIPIFSFDYTHSFKIMELPVDICSALKSSVIKDFCQLFSSLVTTVKRLTLRVVKKVIMFSKF